MDHDFKNTPIGDELYKEVIFNSKDTLYCANSIQASAVCFQVKMIDRFRNMCLFRNTWGVYSSTTTNMGECILLCLLQGWMLHCWKRRMSCQKSTKTWRLLNHTRFVNVKCPVPPLCMLRAMLSHHNLLQTTRASTYMAVCGCCSDSAILREIPTMWDIS